MFSYPLWVRERLRYSDELHEPWVLRHGLTQRCCLLSFLECIAYNISVAIINSRLCSLDRSLRQRYNSTVTPNAGSLRGNIYAEGPLMECIKHLRSSQAFTLNPAVNYRRLFRTRSQKIVRRSPLLERFRTFLGYSRKLLLLRLLDSTHFSTVSGDRKQKYSKKRT